MNKQFRKLLAAALTVCTVSSFAVFGASAAEPEAYVDGRYSAKLAVLKEDKDAVSMSGAGYDSDVELTVTGGVAVVDLYTFNKSGNIEKPDIKDIHITLDGQRIDAQAADTLVDRVADVTSPMLGITAGKTYSAQQQRLTVPVSALETFKTGMPAAAVSAAMGQEKPCRFQLSEITLVEAAAPQADETSQHSLTLSADVAAPVPRYDVVVPEEISMGTLSATEDNYADYTVDVTAENLGGATVSITATSEGLLTSGSNMLFFMNHFDDQTTGVSAQYSGRFHIAHTAVAKAAAGNYTGTVVFDVTYNP